MKALNEAYSDVNTQIAAMARENKCGTGLALRMLSVDRLALHEGTERIIASERKARESQGRMT